MPLIAKKRRQKQKQRKRVAEREKGEQEERKLTFEQLEERINKREVRVDSLNYLVTWKQQKQDWKFKKSRQVWLLKNIYNLWQIPIKHFRILVKYLQSMPSGLQAQVKEEAVKMLENPKDLVYDQIELKVEPDVKQKVKSSKLKRAEKVAQALSGQAQEE